jgi:hypothetical protein
MIGCKPHFGGPALASPLVPPYDNFLIEFSWAQEWLAEMGSQILE